NALLSTRRSIRGTLVLEKPDVSPYLLARESEEAAVRRQIEVARWGGFRKQLGPHRDGLALVRRDFSELRLPSPDRGGEPQPAPRLLPAQAAEPRGLGER